MHLNANSLNRNQKKSSKSLLEKKEKEQFLRHCFDFFYVCASKATSMVSWLTVWDRPSLTKLIVNDLAMLLAPSVSTKISSIIFTQCDYLRVLKSYGKSIKDS
jgi:hypothetical protein